MVGRPRGPAKAGEAKIDLQIALARPLDIVADVEVQVAIVVVVEKGGGRRPLLLPAGHPGIGGDVAETATFVAKQAVRAHRSHEEIRPAVVVVVGSGHAHAEEIDVQT